MTIIDSQVHAYEANTPKRPWHNVPNWPDHVTGDEMAAAMDKVGVDGAIFISPFSMYRYDASYAVDVQRAIPVASRSSSRSTRMIQPSAMSLPIGSRRRARSASASCCRRRRGASRLIRASTGSRARPQSMTFRSTYCAGATWMRARP